MRSVNIVSVLFFSILLLACNANKRLMIRNNNDLFDSLLLKVYVNDLAVFDKRIPLNTVVPDYISKSIGKQDDSVFINIELPEVGITKNASAASKDFKYIYISLTKEPNIEKIDSNLIREEPRNKKEYFKSNISILFTKKKISPLL